MWRRQKTFRNVKQVCSQTLTQTRCVDRYKDLEEQEVGGWQNVTFLSLLFKAAALQLLKCNLRKLWGRVETCLKTSHASCNWAELSLKTTSLIMNNCSSNHKSTSRNQLTDARHRYKRICVNFTQRFISHIHILKLRSNTPHTQNCVHLWIISASNFFLCPN